MKKVLFPVLITLVGMITVLFLSGCSGFSRNVNECMEKINHNASEAEYSKTISIKARPIGKGDMTYKKVDADEYCGVKYEISFTNISDKDILFDDKIYISEQISEVQGYSVLAPNSTPVLLKPGKSMRFSCDKALMIPEKADAA